MAELRAGLVGVLGELDELLAAVEASAEDEETKEELRELAAGVRLRVQLGATRVDGIAALLRAAQDRRRQLSSRPRRAAQPPLRKASAR
jgi:hypothetical protein